MVEAANARSQVGGGHLHTMLCAGGSVEKLNTNWIFHHHEVRDDA